MVTMPPPRRKSLAAIGRIEGIATDCVTNNVPSTKKLTLVAVQSIRYLCGAPSQLPGISTSVAVPLFTEA